MTRTADPSTYQIRIFWEQVLKDGPLALTKQDWRAIEEKLDPSSQRILRHLIEGIEQQTKWVTERMAAMRDEAERVELLGKTMRRAGLRSYTDEKGRVFIAAE